MFTLQIIGKKKSGKTTTMIHFIEKANELSIKIATFKHTHHTVSMDTPGTDTYRFAQAGASQVGMQNDKGFFWHEQRSLEEKVSLQEEIQRFVTADTEGLLIEGFKTEHYPRLLLLRPEDAITDFTRTDIEYIGTIYPEKVEDGVLDLTTKEKSQAWFEQFMQRSKK